MLGNQGRYQYETNKSIDRFKTVAWIPSTAQQNARYQKMAGTCNALNHADHGWTMR
jgi:hypothetical protein